MEVLHRVFVTSCTISSLCLSRALAHVIRHPASEHTDDIGIGHHYENIQTRVTVKSLRKYTDVQFPLFTTHSCFLSAFPCPRCRKVLSLTLSLNKYQHKMVTPVCLYSPDSPEIAVEQEVVVVVVGGLIHNPTGW